MNRRRFLRGSAGAAILLSLPRRAYAFFQSPGLQKFVQPLRGVGPGGIPMAVADPLGAPVTGALHYTIEMRQLTDGLHPALGPTTLWGYNPTRALGTSGTPTQKHLGGFIIARKGTPIQVTFRNELPTRHILPIDRTLEGASPPDNRTSVHVHGGFVPWISDGGPFAWSSPDSPTQGPSFLQNTVLNPRAARNEAEHYYPNQQSARFAWYHDHALGITRANVYGGLASAYIIRDDFEEHLVEAGLPGFMENGGREIPIAIQDKIFVNAATLGALDPTWPGPTTTGSLWYPHVYEPDRWTAGPDFHPPDPSVVPELFGDTMLANGTVYPEVVVEPARYRLRILNACNARFLNLQMYLDDGSADGITLDANLRPTNASAFPVDGFLQLGTEAGFLPVTVRVPSDVPFDPITLAGSLLMAPAERADVIVDFRGLAGQKVILYNDAPAPFPVGDVINDYFPGSSNPTPTAPGFGPHTRQIMRFVVQRANGGHLATHDDGEELDLGPGTDLREGNAPLLVRPDEPAPTVARVRRLSLNEGFDERGRLLQQLGSVDARGVAVPLGFDAPPTETPAPGDIEIWEITNLTGDTHPIHVHLVNVQILSRQPFALDENGVIKPLSPLRPPDPNEAGWKETVRMNPSEITRVIMKFDLPVVPFVVPPSPRTGGNEYMWHCHILEHEEHDMMRPLIVG